VLLSSCGACRGSSYAKCTMAPKRAGGKSAEAKAPPKAAPKRGAKASEPEAPPKRRRLPAPPPPKEAAPKRAAKAAPAVEPEPQDDEFDSWSVARLKSKLKDLGATATGSKQDLVDRVRMCMAESSEKGKAKAKAKAKEKETAESKAKAKPKEEPVKRKAPESSAEADNAAKKSKGPDGEPQPPPSQDVEFEDGEFKAEYAKSGKSCCKKCAKNIEQGEMRLGKMVPSDKFDGKVPMWFHHQCFLARSTLPKSTQLISGFSTLRPEDQDIVLQKVPSVASEGDDEVDAATREEARKQNEQVFEIQDALKVLSEAHLKEMMALNGYPTVKIGSSTPIISLCADGILFGACKACDICESGNILLCGEAYRCNGWVNEFLKCSHRTREPEREVWQLTTAAKAIDALKSKKLKTGTRVFASKFKMHHDAEEGSTAASGSQSSQPNKPLTGIIIAIVDKPETTSADQLIDLVQKNGGEHVQELTKNVSCAISHQGAVDDEMEEVAKAKELGVPGVTEQFITECIEKAGVVDMTPFLLWGEARRAKKIEEVANKFIKKDGISISADVGELADKAHVLVDMCEKRVYSEMMSRTDLGSGTNSFYILHLLESDERDDSTGEYSYWIFRKWGRIGVSQGGTKLEPFGTQKHKAISSFSKRYLDKTGNNFGHNPGDFVVKPAKFIRVDMDHKVGPPSKKAKTEAAADESGSADQPLGKLSKAQIEKGDAVLDRIEAAINDSACEEMSAKAAAKLKGMSAEYYSLIPHNFGMGMPPTINNSELLGAEKELLQFYLRMGFEDMDQPDDSLTPISGVMDLELPKTLHQAAKHVCSNSDIKSCTDKGKKLDAKKAGKPVGEMNPDFYGSILLYTANAIYKDLNKCLRDEDRAKVSKYFSYLRLLFEACGRLPQKKKTLWRGIGVDLFKSYTVGSTIIWWGVSSCTSDKKVAENFMSGCGDDATFLTVETTSATDISELSFYSNEAESILMPGTKLEVLSAEKKGKKAYIKLREVGRVVN